MASGQDSKLKTSALHAPPGGFRPGGLFKLARGLYHKLPFVGRFGPALKARFYALLGVVAPDSVLVQRYKAWQSLQARKRFFREPLPGVGIPSDAGEGPSLFQFTRPKPGFADILFFPVIDWDYRFQRPQQLAVQLAARGHRVFYLEPEVDARGKAGEMPTVKKERNNLYRVLLSHSHPLKVYEKVCSDEEAGALRESLEKLLQAFGSRAVISVIDHPGWFPVARYLPNNTLLYDCMDHHAGFGTMDEAMLKLEESCADHADVLVVTARKLFERFSEKHAPVLIPNAADYSYFSEQPEKIHRDSDAIVLGYYGAIAEWFDAEIIATIAEAHPDYRIVLIGDTHGSDLSSLEKYSNIKLVGEVPYQELTQWLYGFDVCLLPFKVNDLTLATNPVKVYEYLAAGKPVVSVDLPEMEPLKDYVYLARTPKRFVECLDLALCEEVGRGLVRQGYARDQTWRERAKAMISAVEKAAPKVSVMVLTYNNLELTKACLQSLMQDSEYSNLELIVFDNGSTDGTREYLEELQKGTANLTAILSETNLGFAAGNNKAAEKATGEYLVFLNNDTVVSKGWVRDMLRHFREEPRLGLLGPVTNNIGNEAQIEIAYENFDEMNRLARAYCRQRAGQRFEIPVPAFFCVMLTRKVWAEVGRLDERYGLGFFEDDDYAQRVKKAGYLLRCAEDVFVHHHLSATFDKRGEQANAELFEHNRKLYEEKWGPWKPHQYRNGVGG